MVATTTTGTTMADFVDRSLGIGYAGWVLILLMLLVSTLFLWYRVVGSIAAEAVTSNKAEVFYRVTILFSQTLGTALGDWMADTNRLGYLVFAIGLMLVAGGYFYTFISHTFLFWCAFILTRPLGATLRDLLDKPIADGGFAFSLHIASAILASIIILCIIFLPQKVGKHP